MPPKKSLPCYECGEPAEAAISQSEKNPNRPYYKCRNCGENGQASLFLGWMEEYDGKAPQRKRSAPPKKSQRREEEEEEEEERPRKKRGADPHSLPGSLPEVAPTAPPTSFLDTFLKGKILSSHENGEQILLQLKTLNSNIEFLLEKLLESEGKKEALL